MMIVVTGKLPRMPDPGTITRYAAAAPPDRGGSFSGSGFPFADERQAFETSPNVGVLVTDAGGNYSVRIVPPNSFYRRLGSDLVPPTLFVSYVSGGRREAASTVVGRPIAFRTLTYPVERHDVTFYDDAGNHDVDHPVRDARTQEQILREAGYPASRVQPPGFWGQVPPRG